MASVVAKFEFPDNHSAQIAAQKCNEVSGGASAVLNEVTIFDYAKDPAKCQQICQAHGGRAK